MLSTNQRGNQSYIWGMCWHAIWERSNADGIGLRVFKEATMANNWMTLT
jgi:hypothetical protein